MDMSPHTKRSARKELRVLIEGALAKEAALSADASRRVVNRILRQADRIADLGCSLRAAETRQPAAAPITASQPEFDPFAIGAVVTLQRLGADGLMDRLGAIGSVENLRCLAVAQNLSLRTDWSTAEELRLAIVRGAEQRLAERRAAAS